MLIEWFSMLSTMQLFQVDINKWEICFKGLCCFQWFKNIHRSIDFVVNSNRDVFYVRAGMSAIFPLDEEKDLVCFPSESFCYPEYFNPLELDRVLKMLGQF